MPGQSHLQEETPLLLKQLPPSPNAESTSGLSNGASLLFNKLDPDPKTGLFISLVLFIVGDEPSGACWM